MEGKTLLARGMRLNNTLAPEIKNFSTNIPQTDALLPVKKMSTLI